MGHWSKTAAVVGLGAIATGAYATLIERNAFVLRRYTVPVLPKGSADVRVLHISDIHLMPNQTRKQNWLRSLAMYETDLVINTGDNIADASSIEPLLAALDPLLNRPGAFVFGSNDYFSPGMKNPFGYFGELNKETTKREPDLPWERMRDEFVARGWVNLTNAKANLMIRGMKFSFAGVDDPHLNYDKLSKAAGPAKKRSAINIGVTHAPYLRVLDTWNSAGFQLILAGHTHGGQVGIPGYGALVTNCDIDTKRAKGLHQHQVDGNPPSWLHVSAGSGTSPYAPIRFATRPEATLLTLTALDSGVG